jgi:hypothetical protein
MDIESEVWVQEYGHVRSVSPVLAGAAASPRVTSVVSSTDPAPMPVLDELATEVDGPASAAFLYSSPDRTIHPPCHHLHQ